MKTPIRLAVIGNPIAHSHSPEIHARFAAQFDLPITYDKILTTENDFKKTVDTLREEGAKGANITAPFKQQALQYADELTERATKANSVNTLIFNDKTCIGDNTDGTGLIQALTRKHHIPLRNQNILMIGAGGSACGILPALLNEGPNKITIANRHKARALALTTQFSVMPFQEKDTSTAFDLIINATHANFDSHFFLNKISNLKQTICYDLNYTNRHQPFYQWCKNRQANTIIDGYQMLIGQAAESFYQWFSLRPHW